MATPSDPLPPEVRDALGRGDALEAIRLLRQRSGLGLKEAKAVVGAGVATRMPTARRAGERPATFPTQAPDAASFPTSVTGPVDPARNATTGFTAGGHPGLSPGEVPRREGALRWLIVVAALALVLWLVLAR